MSSAAEFNQQSNFLSHNNLLIEIFIYFRCLYLNKANEYPGFHSLLDSACPNMKV